MIRRDTASDVASGFVEQRLREQLVAQFSIVELELLAQDIGLDYEEFPTEPKSEFANELIRAAKRRGVLHDLVQHMREQRPDAK